MQHDSTLTPRARRRESNLQRILDTAMDQVVADGFGAFSVHKLAAAVDYTPGALYRYYPSKDAILAALVLRVIEELDGVVAAVDAPDPLSKVIALCDAYRGYAFERPQRFGMLAMLLAEPRVVFADSDDSAPAVLAMLKALGPLALAFEQAVHGDLLEPGPSESRALVTFASLHGVLSLRKQSVVAPAAIDIDHMMSELLRTLLRGWGARPEALERVLVERSL